MAVGAFTLAFRGKTALALETKLLTCLLQPARPQDEEVLVRLFAESQQLLTGVSADDALWQTLIAMQYRGRKQTYLAAFPAAEDSILCIEDPLDGLKPVGRLLLDRASNRWRIVDIAVLAEYRQKGLGTWVLENCQQQCRTAGAELILQVKPENRARRLYARLGFRTTSEDALSVEMVWDGGRTR